MSPRLLLHLVLQLLLSRSSLQCTAPFIDRLGSCVFVSNRTEPIGWCDAAKFCQSIGGELLMNLAGLRAVNHWVDYYYVGVTDLLVERGTNRDGWRFANGSIFPILTDSDWRHGLPNDLSTDDDFLVVSIVGFRDNPPDLQENFICQPVATPNSQVMLGSSFLRLGNISPTYCYTDAAVSTELHCLWLCVQRWECRAALFNRVSGACRMLDFADSSVGDVIETDPSWVKYVKSYGS